MWELDEIVRIPDDRVLEIPRCPALPGKDVKIDVTSLNARRSLDACSFAALMTLEFLPAFAIKRRIFQR
jgi:hypothetical protein